MRFYCLNTLLHWKSLPELLSTCAKILKFTLPIFFQWEHYHHWTSDMIGMRDMIIACMFPQSVRKIKAFFTHLCVNYNVFMGLSHFVVHVLLTSFMIQFVTIFTIQRNVRKSMHGDICLHQIHTVWEWISLPLVNCRPHC